MQKVSCPCGSAYYEDGFIEDTSAYGRVRWLTGPLQLGPMGNPRKVGRHQRYVRATRCTGCGRLTLFAV